MVGVRNAGMLEKVIFRSICGQFVVDLWSICGRFVVDLWSICGHFVVDLWSITGQREYGTVPTAIPLHTNTEDAEARMIATKRQRPLVLLY